MHLLFLYFKFKSTPILTPLQNFPKIGDSLPYFYKLGIMLNDMNAKLSFVVWIVLGVISLGASAICFWMRVSLWLSIPLLGAGIVCLFFALCCYLLSCISSSESDEDDEHDSYCCDDDYCGEDYQEEGLPKN